MYYVYILKSVRHSEKIYVGYTVAVDQRLSEHNAGESMYTAKYRPWILHGYVTFQEESKAIAFEKYLKSGSGKNFARRHFL